MIKQILTSSIWQEQFLGNSIKKYVISFLALLLFLIIFKIFQKIILAKLSSLAKKTKTDLDDTFINIIKSIKPPFYLFLSFYLAINFLSINYSFKKVIEAVLIIWLVYQIIIAVQIFIDYFFSKNTDTESRTIIPLISKIVKGILWLFGILLVLSNLGVNITSLITGLGIGGIAIALAVQNILGSLLSSFAIHFDRPFIVGDFIVVGTDKGTVEKIGIKTTRIKSPQGEEIVISNNELTEVRVHNYKKMEERRITFSFGVTYDTPLKKMKAIPKIVEDIIGGVESTRFDRVHFHQFGDSALMYEVVYYVDSNDYGKYMDANQAIHLSIKEKFDKEKISMAFPTQTVYLEK